MNDTVCTKCGGTKFYTVCKNCEENPYTTIAALKARRDELLAALKRIVEDVKNMVDDGIICDVMDDIIYVEAQAAIANAEGVKDGS